MTESSGGVGAGVDDLDRQILDLLLEDGRMSNKSLAERVRVAPSTTLARMRAMLQRGVIRGFTVQVDPAALGFPLQAMISVRLHADARAHIGAFQEHVVALPEVINLYFLGGGVDFLAQVAVRDSQELRNFVLDSLSARPEVAMTETSIVFDHVSGGSRRRMRPSSP